MSYFKYMVSSYQSSLPLSTSRSMRSSSLERSYSSNYNYDRAMSRFARASTAPPATATDVSYYGVMPFNRSLNAIEDRIRMRASTIEPVNTYSRAYRSTTPYGASTSYDYKVMDYANRLDREETTRSYINNLRSDYYSRTMTGPTFSAYTSSFDNPYDTWKDRSSLPGRGPTSSDLYEERLRRRPGDLTGYRVDSRDLYSYKHYRKSNATLEDRNTRAKSPLLSRELDRYYKTERRASYLGDISSGGQRDFRYYNYRHVPYYGGSDYYTLTQQQNRI